MVLQPPRLGQQRMTPAPGERRLGGSQLRHRIIAQLALQAAISGGGPKFACREQHAIGTGDFRRSGGRRGEYVEQ